MDFAQLGIKLDTNDVEKGLRQLKEIPRTGAGAAAAADKLQKKLVSAGLAQERLAMSTARANKQSALSTIASGRLSKAKVQEQRAIIKAAEAQIKASAARSANIKKLNDEIVAQRRLIEVTNAATLATNKNSASLGGVATRFTGGGGGRGFGVANDPANDLMPNRFNTANIAAQFQDIGVTAAMGMNPLTIALQQGTQLSAILNTMESPLKGIAVAFRSIINVVSLTSIAIVALLAVGIQFIDWASVARKGASLLADGFDFLADNADILALSLGALTISLIALNFTSIIGGIVAATTAIIALAAVIWAVIAPFAVVAAAAAAFGGLMYYLFGDRFIEAIRTAVNTGIGFLVGFVNSIRRIFTESNVGAIIVDFLLAPINLALTLVKTALNALIIGINKIIENLPDWLKDRTSISEIEFQFNITDNFTNPLEGGVKDAARIITDEFGNALGNVDYVGKISEGVRSGLDSVSGKLRDFAAGVIGAENSGSESEVEKQADAYTGIISKAKQRVESLKLEQSWIGKNEREVSRLRITQELLNDAKQKGIDLDKDQIRELERVAAETAALEERNRQLNESYDLLRDTGKGFFSDMRKGLEEGQSAWESFSNAVINAANRMLNAFIDASLDQATTALAGMGSSVADWLFNAKGNAFSESGVEKYAKGGAFTNSIVSSPTMFTFANGGKFGVMGEAGPEAVMPLKRGPDGSLGVGMSGGGVVVNNQPPAIIINNNAPNTDVRAGLSNSGESIEVIIDQITAGNIKRRGTQTSIALRQSQKGAF